MAEGFSIDLPGFCSYCGALEPECVVTDISAVGDKAERFLTAIHCQNEGKCTRLADSLIERNG
jgi:hypothetical protein